MNLSDHIKVTIAMGHQAAGTSSPLNGTSLDMQGFDGVMFVGIVGTLTATQATTLKAQSAPDNATWSDLAGTHYNFADSQSGDAAILDIFEPLGTTAGTAPAGAQPDRYVRPVITRGTANAEILGIVAIQYQADHKPTAQDATTIVNTLKLQNSVYGTA